MADIRIGSLYHTYDPRGLQEASAALREYAQRAKQTVDNSGVGAAMRKDASDTDAATKAVTALQESFGRLQGTWRVGKQGAEEYAQGMRDFQTEAQSVVKEMDLTGRQTKTVGSLFRSAGTEIGRANVEMLRGLNETTLSVKGQIEPWKLLKNEVYNARSAYEADKISLTELLTVMQRIKTEALADADAIDKNTLATKEGSAAYKAYMDAAGAASRYMATASGQTSKLGLSANFAAAANMGLTNSLMRFGPAGIVAGQALGEVGIGALGAAAGIGAVGYGAYKLVQRGIPQIAEMQKAVQLLAASGQAMTQSHLADTLRNIQEQAGKAGDQFNRAELATALSELVKAGLPAADAMNLLAPGMQLAAVTGQNLNDSTGLLLQNLRQFNLSADQAQRAANDLAQADLLSASSAQALSEGLATVGPVAAQSGLSLEQTLGILTELSNKGLDPATTGGNALRVVMTSLLRPSAQAQEALKTLGVSTKDTAGHQRDMMSILTDLRKALQTYGITVDKNTDQIVGQYDAATEAARVFRTRGITAVLAMGDATDTLTKKIEGSQGALKGYADTMLSNNVQAATNALKKAIDDLSASFTVALVPAITTAIESLTEFLNKLDAFLHPNAQADAITSSFLGQSGDAGLTAIMGVYQKDLLERAAQQKLLQGLQERLANAHLAEQRNALQRAIDLTQQKVDALETKIKGDEAALNRRQAQLRADQAKSDAAANAAGGSGGAGGGGGSGATTDVGSLIREVTGLVQTLNAANKGTNPMAAYQAQSNLDEWLNTGDATSVALRRAVLSAVQRTISNSTKEAAKNLDQWQPSGAELAAGMVRWAKLSNNPTAMAQSEMQQGANGAIQSADAIKKYNAEVAASNDAATKAVAVIEAQRQAIIASGALRQGGQTAGGPAYLTSNGQSAAESALFSKYASAAGTENNPILAAMDTLQRQAMLAASGILQGGPAQAGEQTKKVQDAVKKYQDAQYALFEDALKIATNDTAKRLYAPQTVATVSATSRVNAAGGMMGTVGAPYGSSTWQAMQAGQLQGGSTNTAYAQGQGYADATVANFTDTLNRLSEAGREVATNQKKAGDEAAAKWAQAADQFAHTVIAAGQNFIDAISAFSQGDVKGGVTSLASAAGGIASLIPGGQIIGGIIQAAAPLIGEIAQGISDLFSGDSPAQRALRQSLTQTVSSAFSQGIMAGVSGQQGWQQTLSDNIKAGLLQALVQTFIQTAIMQAIMQPFIAQYVRILDQQGSQAAMDFLNQNAAGVIDKATSAAEGFVSAIPSDLLPSQGGGGGSSSPGGVTGITSLPAATQLLAAPDWAPEMLAASKNLSVAADKLSGAADKLSAAAQPGGTGLATYNGATA